jgi:hypothetical protein
MLRPLALVASLPSADASPPVELALSHAAVAVPCAASRLRPLRLQERELRRLRGRIGEDARGLAARGLERGEGETLVRAPARLQLRRSLRR